MNDVEIIDLQRRIDEGIKLAHARLMERASLTRQTLVVCRGGKIMDIVPEEGRHRTLSMAGDPLARRVNK